MQTKLNVMLTCRLQEATELSDSFEPKIRNTVTLMTLM